jgi:flavin reductase (DIM6/NTAB) family NADH-FMN oxidoreductase RutF
VPDHELPAESLSKGDRYRLMSSIIIPRPIAWVSTVSADGVRNLAPYSYFQAMSSDPPTVVLGMGWHASGKPKDSLRNVLDTGEFCVSLVSEALAEPMNQSSGTYAPEVEEWEVTGVESAPSTAIAAPRVNEALAALECRLVQAIPLGLGPAGSPSTSLVIGRIVHFHLREGLLSRDQKGRVMAVDPARLAAIGRLGGIAYTKTSDRFELVRPKVP